MKAAKAFFIVLILVIFLVLLFENYQALSQPFSLKADLLIVHWSIPEYPIGAYLLFSFLFGFLLAGFLHFISRIRMGVRLREQDKKLREAANIPQESKNTAIVEE